MEKLTAKQIILAQTHHGIKIYAYILKQFYPGDTVIRIKERVCHTTRNPFNHNKPTLKIYIEKGVARHYDIEEAIPQGNVFDFSELYFDVKGPQLIEKLNKVFCLNRTTERQVYNIEERSLLVKRNVSQPLFSYFKAPISNVKPSSKVNLIDVYNIITGDTLVTQTDVLRFTKDVSQSKKYKAFNFDYVTFSGVFSTRKNSCLVSHSGLMVLDFDHVKKIETLKHTLLNDPEIETELLFTSPSGNGLKWVVKVDLTELSHAQYFQAISNYLFQKYNLKTDQSGKDVSRACFLAYDPSAYLNKNNLP